jgi:hypothetical protein
MLTGTVVIARGRQVSPAWLRRPNPNPNRTRASRSAMAKGVEGIPPTAVEDLDPRSDVEIGRSMLIIWHLLSDPDTRYAPVADLGHCCNRTSKALDRFPFRVERCLRSDSRSRTLTGRGPSGW